MGQNCSDDVQWCNDVLRPDKTRQKFTSQKFNSQKFRKKEQIPIKKYAITDDYFIIRKPIGQGSYGIVYKAFNKQSGLQRAVKKISKKKKNREYMQQILLVRKLDHPHILKILDVYEEQFFIYIVMDLYSGGQLFDKIVSNQAMSQSIARQYMKQLLSAIAYCHMNKIIHRDLKPQNIMFTSVNSESLKIIDFGQGKIKQSGKDITLKVGSVYYMAPEVIKKKYDQKCDIWSLGVILYMMMSGKAPFNGKTDDIIFDNILKGEFSFEQNKWGKVSEQLKDLIKKMLRYDAGRRYSAKKALNHDWFKMEQKEQKNLYLLNEMQSIRKFCKMNKFQTNIMMYISRNLLTNDTLGKLNKKFNQIDKNRDGRISWKQFKHSYYQIMQPIQQQNLVQIFQKIDQNNSGYIDYSEFIASTFNQQRLQSNQILNKAFNMIDTNHDGYLTNQQINNALWGISQQIYRQMLKQCDLDKDQKISRQQFMIGMRKLVKNKNI